MIDSFSLVELQYTVAYRIEQQIVTVYAIHFAANSSGENYSLY